MGSFGTVVYKNSGVCTMFILKGKALRKLMFKGICVLETCTDTRGLLICT